MNAQRTRFVIEYCVDYNGSAAAVRAGYSENGAGTQAYELLKNPKIQAAIKEREEELAASVGVTVQFVLRQWMDIARADASKLTRVQIGNCRHCYGVGHAYQWTESEYLQACEVAIARKKPVPDGMGGFGFDVKREPHPDCPECGGAGTQRVLLADTSKLDRAERRLFVSAQQTKDGIRVLTRDQDKALENLARYLGMNKDTINLNTFEAKSLDEFYATVNKFAGTNT